MSTSFEELITQSLRLVLRRLGRLSRQTYTVVSGRACLVDKRLEVCVFGIDLGDSFVM